MGQKLQPVDFVADVDERISRRLGSAKASDNTSSSSSLLSICTLCPLAIDCVDGSMSAAGPQIVETAKKVICRSRAARTALRNSVALEDWCPSEVAAALNIHQQRRFEIVERAGQVRLLRTFREREMQPIR